MPLYEYECTSCHRRIEKIQKFSDADLTICPSCGGALERTITAAAISFKGGGWYKDGYASVKPATSGGDSSGDSSNSGGAESSSSGATAASGGTNAGSSDAGSSAKASESPKSTPAPAATAAPAAAPKP